ncbi:transposase [Xanthobacter flavus]|uniref:transposase n=1 Tax=Xanthobacter flavus TaxID=281 RepID=UPI00372D3ED2
MTEVDKAYDTDAIRAETAERGAFANVPPRVIRKRTFAFSPWLYRQRNQIERVFNHIKQMRGLSTRYGRRPDKFLAALKLAATRTWISA